MYKQGYSEYIRNCINLMEHNRPIYTTSLAQEFAGHFQLDLQYARKIVNQNMKRLADKGIIARFSKGIYYRPIETPFGKSVLNKSDMLYNTLTYENSEIIGYEGCPSVLNTLGLSTQLTAEKNIVTNRYRMIIPKGANIRLTKPKCHIDSDNFCYLQAIDIIRGTREYPIDAKDPRKIIEKHLAKFNIEPLKLIAFAKKYGTEKTLTGILDFFTEGLV